MVLFAYPILCSFIFGVLVVINYITGLNFHWIALATFAILMTLLLGPTISF